MIDKDELLKLVTEDVVINSKDNNIVTVDETVTVTEDKEYYAIYERTDRITLKYVYTTYF